MEDIRDALISFSDEHERDCPGGGKPCRNNRAAMIGYLAHCLGIRAPDQWARVKEIAEEYDSHCQGLNCRHELNGRVNHV